MATAGIGARLSLNSSQFNSGMSNAARTAHETVARLNQQFQQFQNVTTKGALTGVAMFAVRDISNTVAAYEKLDRQLAAISGGAAGAAVQFERLKQLVGETPALTLDSAVDGITRLKTMGFSAKDAEDKLATLSNLVATFGGGNNEIKGVLMAFSQIATKTSVMAEEINQLAERVPTIRADLMEIFGTANPDTLRKMGVDSTDVIQKLLDKWKELPQVTSGYNEELKKLQLTLNDLKNYMGGEILPVLAKVTNEFLRGAKAAHQIATDSFAGAFDYIFGTDTQGLRRNEAANRYEKGIMEIDASDRETAKRAKEAAAARREEQRKERNERNTEERIKFMQQRDRILKGDREDLAEIDPQRAIDAIDAELARLTDRSMVMDQIYEKIRKNTALTDEELRYMERINGMLKERDALQERINAKNRAEFNARVDEEMMSPSERKRKMREKFDRERAAKAVMRDMERKRLNKEEEEERGRRLDRQKAGMPAWDKDEARKRIRKGVAEELQKAFRDNNVILSSIEQILKTLATA